MQRESPSNEEKSRRIVDVCAWRKSGGKGTPRTLPSVTKNSNFPAFVHGPFGACWALLLACLGGCATGESYDKSTVFRYNESAAITSLDPAAARSLEHMWVVDQLYDGLVELDDELNIQPCLAESWVVDEAGLTYTFGLREGVQFSTGNPVTATDVVQSLERLRSGEVASSGGWILEQVTPGGIVALNDHEVQITLNRPYPPFLGLLTTAYGSIIDAKHRESLRDTPAGSGPFVLAWWLPDAGLVLHKNPDYWERDEEGRALPYLEAVHVDVVTDMGAEYLGLAQGRYDFMSGLHPAFMETLLDQDGELRDAHRPSLRLARTPFLKTDYLGVVLDGQETPDALKDVRVRRAMSMAIDRRGLVKHLRRNVVFPTDHFVPPSMLGLAEPVAVSQQVDSALLLMEEAGYPEGQGVETIMLSTTSDYVDLCAALQHDWQRIGLDVKVDVVPASVHRERVAMGETAMFYKSWLADHADAENFLALFVRSNFAPNGPNYTHYESEAFEQGFAQAMASTGGPSDRWGQYRRLDALLHQDMPVIPLFHDQVSHFVNVDVEGWQVHPVNRLDLRRVRKGSGSD